MIGATLLNAITIEDRISFIEIFIMPLMKNI